MIKGSFNIKLSLLSIEVSSLSACNLDYVRKVASKSKSLLGDFGSHKVEVPAIDEVFILLMWLLRAGWIRTSIFLKPYLTSILNSLLSCGVISSFLNLNFRF